MVIENIIQEKLFGLVGFRQSTYSGYTSIFDDGDSLLTSTSGLYFEDASGFVTIRNIKETQENPDITTAQFKTYLTNQVKAAILTVINKLIAGKSEFIENNTLFPYVNRYVNKTTPETGFVGIQIRPALNKRLLLNIGTISLTFDTAQALDIYCLSSEHPGKDNYLYKQSITCADRTAVRQQVNWKIGLSNVYLGTSSARKDNIAGEYYIGYFEDDLNGMQPYKRDYQSSNVYHGSRHFYMDFKRFGFISGTIIDPDDDTAITDPFGINIEYSVYTDYTNLIIQNRDLFARAIQLQFAERTLNNIITSTRSNAVERMNKKMREIAFVDMGAENNHSSIIKQLNAEVDSLKRALFPEPKIITAMLK